MMPGKDDKEGWKGRCDGGGGVKEDTGTDRLATCKSR